MITQITDKEIAQAAEIEQLRQEVTAWSITAENLEAELESIAESDDGAGGEGMKLLLENRALKAKLADQTKAADHWMEEACKNHNDLVRANEKLAEFLAQKPVAWLYEVNGRIKLETKRLDNYYWMGEGDSWVKGKPLILAAGAAPKDCGCADQRDCDGTCCKAAPAPVQQDDPTHPQFIAGFKSGSYSARRRMDLHPEKYPDISFGEVICPECDHKFVAYTAAPVQQEPVAQVETDWRNGMERVDWRFKPGAFTRFPTGTYDLYAAPVPRMTGAALASQEPVAEVLLVDGEKVIDASMAFFDSVELGTKLYLAAGAAPVPNAELAEALEDLMSWQVKNVKRWHNAAYDNAARVLKKLEAGAAPAAKVPEEPRIDINDLSGMIAAVIKEQP